MGVPALLLVTSTLGNAWVLKWPGFSKKPVTDASQSCATFALTNTNFLQQANAAVVNSTFWPALSYKSSSTSNNVDFCEVFTTIKYGDSQTLNFALWLPSSSNYQNRFMAVGNGAYAGVIDFDNMIYQLNNGYGMAVAGGDAGHSAQDNLKGLGMPGVALPFLQDPASTSAWIHTSVATFTPVARHLVEIYYNLRPRYSYFDGCSTGGAQAFALAQRYPDLYDGIYAGSPGDHYSHLILSFLWNSQKTDGLLASLSLSTLSAITNAVIAQCDGLDGVLDGVIENPLKCKFDINSLACPSLTNPLTCLSSSQLAAAKAIYAGPVRSDNGAEVYPGFNVGSEVGWILQEGLLAAGSAIPILQNLVFKNLTWDPKTFNWASDVDTVDAQAGSVLDSISPELCAFRRHGGKLISSQGWADPINAAGWPLERLAQMKNASNGDVSDFYSLFMVPSGGHCGALPSQPLVPGNYHRVPLLVDWVENGKRPTEMLSTNPPIGTRTRKLCPWPQQAVWNGQGDSNVAESYSCQVVS